MDSNLASILAVLEPDADNHVLLGKAAALAARTGARLRLFCCDRDPRLTARLLLSPDALSAARAGHLRRRRDWLATLAEPLAADGIEVEIEAAWDAPLHAGVLTEVSLSRPGLVLKEAAWSSQLGRRLFGHTDWRLMQSCPVPVLVTRAEPWPASPRIAAALDPGHPGDPAGVLDRAVLEAGERLAAWTGGSLALVHAYMALDPLLLSALADGLPTSQPAVPAGTDPRDAAASAMAAEVAGRESPSGGIQLLEGEAVEVLPAWCLEQQVDVLAVGVTSRSRMVEAVIGSTAERLLEKAPSDLLAVHGPRP